MRKEVMQVLPRVMPPGFSALTVIHAVNTPFSVKLIHALQRLNELQHFVPLAIEHQLPATIKRFIYNTRVTQRVVSFDKNVLHHFILKRSKQKSKSTFLIKRCAMTR